MRVATAPLPTVRLALAAAVVALAVAAPATLLLDRLRVRPVSAATAAVRPAPAAGTAKPHRLAARRPRPALPGPGLPGSVALALKTNPFVVVALYVAGDSIDMTANSEAQAGAELARVPYVPINVGEESQIGDLASRLPSLMVPSVVVIARGGRVATQLEGYIDRQAVAEAIDGLRTKR
jgi:hypothetical protein